MNDAANSLEALRLISDWAKWLITIEAGALATIGALKQGKAPMSLLAKLCATFAVACFVVSIAAAAFLLLSLPEIAQGVRPETNIWMTSDSAIASALGLNTEGLAKAESLFFGLGVVGFAALIVTGTWSHNEEPLNAFSESPDHKTTRHQQHRKPR